MNNNSSNVYEAAIINKCEPFSDLTQNNTYFHFSRAYVRCIVEKMYAYVEYERRLIKCLPAAIFKSSLLIIILGCSFHSQHKTSLRRRTLA